MKDPFTARVVPLVGIQIEVFCETCGKRLNKTNGLMSSNTALAMQPSVRLVKLLCLECDMKELEKGAGGTNVTGLLTFTARLADGLGITPEELTDEMAKIPKPPPDEPKKKRDF